MTENTPIIDVTPLEHSSDRLHLQKPSRASGENRSETTRNSYSANAAESTATRTPGSFLGGIAETTIGIGLIAIGIPMLILPGPGLLSIGAGALLVARGFSKIRR